MNIHRNATMQAYHRSESSITALGKSELRGDRWNQKAEVYKAWHQASCGQITPCSMRSLSLYITAIVGENFFSRKQTNAEVIRKRTAELATGENPFLLCQPNQTDPDGARRNWYEVAR